MPDIKDAIYEYIEEKRVMIPPSVDLTAPDIILFLRVRLKVGSDDVEILEDETPGQLQALKAHVAQMAEDISRQNAARDARLEKLERESRELYSMRLNDCTRVERTRDRMTDLETRINLTNDIISQILKKSAGREHQQRPIIQKEPKE